MIRTQRTPRHGAIATATAALLLSSVLGTPHPALAEQAWVRGEIRLNLRTGPGSDYRIVRTLKTGDEVTILQRSEKWTQITLAEGGEGWIPAGYLQPQAPPTIRLGQIEQELLGLREQFETVSAQRAALAESNQRLSEADQQQAGQVAELTRENDRLKGGQRWPEWITGAGVLSVGMLLGALWSRSLSRRARPRIKL